jgi:peroxiredoxin
MMGGRAFVALALIVSGCGAPPAPARFPAGYELSLPGSVGRAHDVTAELASRKLTAFVFYSEDCPCMRVHEGRLAELERRYAPSGVRVVLVDSETTAEAARDAAEARKRGYTLPLLTDAGARLARLFGAKYATHTIVVDATGAVRYSGAIDSDKNVLHADAKPNLREAIDALLAGRTPPVPDREPLGCALQTR